MPESQEPTATRSFDLKPHDLDVAEVHRNLPPSSLFEHAIRFEKDAAIAGNVALAAYTGAKGSVWSGPVNIPSDEHTFAVNRRRAIDYLNTRERLYCFDGFAGWDPNYRIKVRVICSRPSDALFAHSMLMRPTRQELENFGEPDFTIYNAGGFPANRLTGGTGSTTSIDLSLEDRELVFLGTESAGEMQQGVFTVANYFAPKRDTLSMRCSATADKQTGR